MWNYSPHVQTTSFGVESMPPLDLWNLVIIKCLRAVCGAQGYPKGSAAELLDGSLKLRFCTAVFVIKQFPFGFYLGWARVLVKEVLLPLVLYWIVEVTLGNRSGYPGRHGQEHLQCPFRIQGIQRRGDGKACAPPFLRRRRV